ncbi:Hypothetical predicted protein [Olea europaea subsp. europaea]|uniref:Uncharacterized protein n=1 Tax=Olea europaea subsp. europaea TaxID=158383 RepID=A0A8S0R114_OLEEU|nr:Hypothetical predicted protein [Olea europaea subsp. europaea]
MPRHKLYTGVHEWRLFGHFFVHLSNFENVLWKLGSMESASRMRSVLRRKYRSSYHFSAAKEHEDNIVQKLEKDKAISPSIASILAAKAISTEVGNEEDEQEDDVQLEGSSNDIEEHGEF